MLGECDNLILNFINNSLKELSTLKFNSKTLFNNKELIVIEQLIECSTYKKFYKKYLKEYKIFLDEYNNKELGWTLQRFNKIKEIGEQILLLRK